MKSSIVTVIVIPVVLLFGCAGEASDDRIDYSEINEIGIELISEFGESENYVPGLFAELELASDGHMLVRDNQKGTIEQFNADGVHLGTVAVQGEGPGELPDSFRFGGIRNDTLVVYDYNGAKGFIYFVRNQNGLFDYDRSTIPELTNQNLRRFIMYGFRTAVEYFALEHPALIPVSYGPQQPNYLNLPVSIIDANSHIVVDSLQTLKIPNIFWGARGFPLSGPPFRSGDKMIILNDLYQDQNLQYLVARPDSSLLLFYNSDHELTKTIHLYVNERSVSAENIEYYFQENGNLENILNSPMISGQMRSEYLDRFSSTQPSFYGIWITRNHIWLQISDEHENEREYVVLNSEGLPLGKFSLSKSSSIQQIQGNQIYTTHRNPEVGATIRVYELAQNSISIDMQD